MTALLGLSRVTDRGAVPWRGSTDGAAGYGEVRE